MLIMKIKLAPQNETTKTQVDKYREKGKLHGSPFCFLYSSN